MSSGVSPERTRTSPSKPSSAGARRRRPRRPCRAALPGRDLDPGAVEASLDVSARATRRRAGRRLERPRGGEHPVDHAPAEQRVQVLRRRRAHAGAEAGGHDDGCEVRRRSRSDGCWGARIRTWDRGTKTRCLTTWLRPIGRRRGIGRLVARPVEEQRRAATTGERGHGDRARASRRTSDEHRDRARRSACDDRGASRSTSRAAARATALWREPEVEAPTTTRQRASTRRARTTGSR